MTPELTAMNAAAFSGNETAISVCTEIVDELAGLDDLKRHDEADRDLSSAIHDAQEAAEKAYIALEWLGVILEENGAAEAVEERDKEAALIIRDIEAGRLAAHPTH